MSAQINLYHPRFRKQREVLTLTNAALLSLVFTVSGAVWAGWARQQHDQISARAGEAVAQVQAQRERLLALTTAATNRKPDAALAADVANAEALLARRQEIVQLLEGGAAGATSGFAEHLRGFARQTLPELWLTGFSIGRGGAEMEIRGRTIRAEALPDYIRRLGSEKSFQGLSFASLTVSRPAPTTSGGGKRRPTSAEFRGCDDTCDRVSVAGNARAGRGRQTVNAINAQWQAWSGKFNALTQREKLIVAGATGVCASLSGLPLCRRSAVPENQRRGAHRRNSARRTTNPADATGPAGDKRQ